MSNQPNKPLSPGYTLFLFFAVAVYSLSGFFTKLASEYDFLSFPYLCCLFGVIVVLGIYAVLWQIVLKKVQLSQAYLFRSLGVIYGLAIAYFAFGETVTLQNIIGCVLVMCGLAILSQAKAAIP